MKRGAASICRLFFVAIRPEAPVWREKLGPVLWRAWANIEIDGRRYIDKWPINI